MHFNAEEMDLSNQILCACCKGVYIQPVELPCGKNICRSHVAEHTEAKNNAKFFKCMLCNKEHQIPGADGFPLNKKIDDLVKKCQVKATPVAEIHKLAHESYDKLNKMVDEFVHISSTSEAFIYEYFSELERKVDVKREMIIQEIHSISDKLIGEIGKQKEDILAHQNKRRKKEEFDRQQLDKYKKELDAYNKELKSYSIDLNKWKTVQVETDDMQKDLQSKIDHFKNELLCNKSIVFKEGKGKLNEKDIFGEIVVKEDKGGISAAEVFLVFIGIFLVGKYFYLI